ncbi:hypothetical protein CIK72_16895 [Brachybacterium alimentarium]|uniref:Uncharacterized protein n=1 Tax=Brachybacterium alimentarium TaxID=47845 RepID=A0A2A3YDS9_9MICO|nr:hypothetical protein CIK66_16620 [Brachybacterium alimentarium]RCS75608.1 hypothetical protein CIK72_16895 [Brachybacterium alimentarium]
MRPSGLSVIGVFEVASFLAGLVEGRREDVLKIRLHEGGQLGAVRYRADSGGLHRLEVDAEAGELVGQLLGQLLGGVCEMSPVGRVVAAGANLALRGSWSG